MSLRVFRRKTHDTRPVGRVVCPYTIYISNLLFQEVPFCLPKMLLHASYVCLCCASGPIRSYCTIFHCLSVIEPMQLSFLLVAPSVSRLTGWGKAVSVPLVAKRTSISPSTDDQVRTVSTCSKPHLCFSDNNSKEGHENKVAKSPEGDLPPPKHTTTRHHCHSG